MPRGRKKGLDPQGWKGSADDSKVVAITTHSAQGEPSSTVVPAPEPAPLPEIQLPTGEEAIVALQGLAEQNQRVQTARRRLEEAQGTVKARKSTLESEQQVLEEMLRKATERKPLPLFDATERERDLAAMQASIEAGQPAAAVSEDVPEVATADAAATQEPRSDAEPMSASVELPFVAPEAPLAETESLPQAVESF